MDNFFCLIDSENAKKCLHSNSAFAILTLRDGDGGEKNPRVEVATKPGTGSKPLLSSEAQKTRQTLREAEPVSSPRPNSTRRLVQEQDTALRIIDN